MFKVELKNKHLNERIVFLKKPSTAVQEICQMFNGRFNCRCLITYQLIMLF
jgi:hypothetical protein